MQRVKYPRTHHLPWSPGRSSDDKVLSAEAVTEMFVGRVVVVSSKLDGENCTIYSDGTCHARSIDSRHHESRAWVKALAARLAQDTPEGWRLCGENVYAEHSISYDSLPGYFVLFAVYDGNNVCLSWGQTVEWADAWGIPVVPLIYWGRWDEAQVKAAWNMHTPHFGDEAEGYVVRLQDGFQYEDFSRSVAKFVRAGHVNPGDTHWMYKPVTPNKIKAK